MKTYYQFSDLSSRNILDEGAEKPARLAVIGKPIQHSASPSMHQVALDAEEIDMRYIRLEVEPGQVAEALKRMKGLGFLGCNVTVPHKMEALECCDELTEDAKAIGAVNTILIEGDKVIGHNTDAPGLARAIREDFGVDLGDLKVMVIGTGGGAGRAIATQCARLGCEQLWLVNRTLEKAEQLAEKLTPYFSNFKHLVGPGEKITTLTNEGAKIIEAAGHVELIINATPLGMKRTDPLPIPSECIQPHHMVYDAIYTPPVTALLAVAQDAGARTSNGFSMLLNQGILAFEFWLPGKSNPKVMKEGLKHLDSLTTKYTKHTKFF